MDALKDYTTTQILKFINDTKEEHDNKKDVLISILDKIKEHEIKLNEEMEKFQFIENKYEMLVSEYKNRGNEWHQPKIK